MESGRRKRRGRDEGKEGREAELRERRRWSPREFGDGGREREGGGGGEGGNVWKLADRTGYAQTGSQAQAQT